MLASLGKNAFGYYAIMFSVVHLSVHASEDARAALKSSSELGLRGLGLRFLVIQLERATERHGPLQRQAQEQGLDLEVLSASDGKSPRFRSRVFPSRHPNATCADVIGAIFDSHRRAWTLAAESDRHTVVFEDDVDLPEDFTALLLPRFRALPATYDIAFLYDGINLWSIIQND